MPGVRGKGCWNCSSMREPNTRLSTLPSSNPRSCMKNSILVVFSFGGFNRVMFLFAFFFFKLLEIARELAKLLMAPLLLTKLSTFQLVFDYYQNSPGRIIKNAHLYITEYVKY